MSLRLSLVGGPMAPGTDSPAVSTPSSGRSSSGSANDQRSGWTARTSARRASTGAAGYLKRWADWSGADGKRLAAQATGRSYRWYLRQGEAVACVRTPRRRSESDVDAESPRSSASFIAQADSLVDMIAKDAPRTLPAREGSSDGGDEVPLTADESMHVASVTRVLTALFGGRVSAAQYRQGISIIVAFLLDVARGASAAKGRAALTQAQAERDEASVFWLIVAVVEDVYPLTLEPRLLLAETTLLWRLLLHHTPRVVAHLTGLFGDALAAEGGFTQVFLTKFLQTLCSDQFVPETACQLWDVLLVAHHQQEQQEQRLQQPAAGGEAEQQEPRPHSAFYRCLAPTALVLRPTAKASKSLSSRARRAAVVAHLQAGSVIEVAERLVAPTGVWLRVCAVAVAIPAEGGPSSSAPQPGHRYHRRDCGGWVSLGEGDGAPRHFVEVKREEAATMLPQIILAFVRLHTEAICATSELSDLVRPFTLGLAAKSLSSLLLFAGWDGWAIRAPRLPAIHHRRRDAPRERAAWRQRPRHRGRPAPVPCGLSRR